MPMHRKNKCKSAHVPVAGGSTWFRNNLYRQRRRNKIAQQSRRRNRK